MHRLSICSAPISGMIPKGDRQQLPARAYARSMHKCQPPCLRRGRTHLGARSALRCSLPRRARVSRRNSSAAIVPSSGASAAATQASRYPGLRATTFWWLAGASTDWSNDSAITARTSDSRLSVRGRKASVARATRSAGSVVVSSSGVAISSSWSRASCRAARNRLN